MDRRRARPHRAERPHVALRRHFAVINVSGVVDGTLCKRHKFGLPGTSVALRFIRDACAPGFTGVS